MRKGCRATGGSASSDRAFKARHEVPCTCSEPRVAPVRDHLQHRSLFGAGAAVGDLLRLPLGLPGSRGHADALQLALERAPPRRLLFLLLCQGIGDRNVLFGVRGGALWRRPAERPSWAPIAGSGRPSGQRAHGPGSPKPREGLGTRPEPTLLPFLTASALRSGAGHRLRGVGTARSPTLTTAMPSRTLRPATSAGAPA